MGKQFTRRDVTSESMALQAKPKDLPTSLFNELTGETGVLAAGALPSLELADAEGEKNLAESVAGGAVSKVKKTKQPKEKAEEVQESTARETLGLIYQDKIR